MPPTVKRGRPTKLVVEARNKAQSKVTTPTTAHENKEQDVAATAGRKAAGEANLTHTAGRVGKTTRTRAVRAATKSAKSTPAAPAAPVVSNALQATPSPLAADVPLPTNFAKVANELAAPSATIVSRAAISNAHWSSPTERPKADMGSLQTLSHDSLACNLWGSNQAQLAITRSKRKVDRDASQVSKSARQAARSAFGA